MARDEEIRPVRVDTVEVGSSILPAPTRTKKLPLSAPTIRSAVRSLEGLGVVRETTGREWNRLRVYSHCLAILSEGVDAVA